MSRHIATVTVSVPSRMLKGEGTTKGVDHLMALYDYISKEELEALDRKFAGEDAEAARKPEVPYSQRRISSPGFFTKNESAD